MVVRVQPEFLAGQQLPPGLVTKHIWNQRFEEIAGFEWYLAQNDDLILRFLPTRLTGGTAEALLRPARAARQELEILDERGQGADVFRRRHESMRGRHPPHCGAARALVRGASERQVVYASGGGKRGCRGSGQGVNSLSCVGGGRRLTARGSRSIRYGYPDSNRRKRR